ncbi:MAG: glycosyltransferase family 2 protein [Candidatus Aminicenantes bacterium]|nr:glycosyltransferase family 2 protein [Candidatus Aminicenantes bacterium]
MPSQDKEGVSFVIPTLNEGGSARAVSEELASMLRSQTFPWEIILVNDGSRPADRHLLEQAAAAGGVRIVHHERPCGYGAAVKSGIEAAQHPWIAITDADGTYPVAEFPALLDRRRGVDMVVGSRQGRIRRIPWLRRPAKWLINRFASYVCRRRIPDVNSGMRLFRRDWAKKFERLLPDGFSLTTTLTIAMIRGRARVEFAPINYLKRRGRSKIRPLRDFSNFVMTILRLSMAFDPLRVVLPLFFASGALTLASLVRDLYHRNLADTTVFLFLFTMLILMIGLLADLINRKLPW